MLKTFAFVLATFLTQILSVFFVRWLGIWSDENQLPITNFTLNVHYFEIFLGIVNLCMIGIWIHDLGKSSLMHSNLKFVCYLISFHISTSCITEFVIIFDKLTHGVYSSPISRMIITVMHGTAQMHFMLDPGAAAIERGLATLKVSKYEKQTSRNQWLFAMFFKEIIAIFFYFILMCTGVGAIAFGIFWILLETSIMIIGIILYRTNLKRYNTRIGSLRLTTRYQTVENIRCLKPVLLYTFLAVIQNVAAFSLLLALVIHALSGDLIGASQCESMMLIVVGIFGNLYPLSFLAYSSRIRKLIEKKTKTFKKSRISSSTSPILSVMGKVMPSKNEQNIYFAQLKTAWK